MSKAANDQAAAPRADRPGRTGPRQNRVTPFGTFQAVADHGTMLGNRGDLHAADGSLGNRRWAGKAWISCSLQAPSGQKARFDRKGAYYPLFFVDEATALAAGHRPCGFCRFEALRHFKQTWAQAHNIPAGQFIRVAEIDAELHRARLGKVSHLPPRGSKFGELPDGAMFVTRADPETAWLAWKTKGRPWHPSGYGPARRFEPDQQIIPLTPLPLIRVLAAGYRPLVHPSADQPL